MILRAVKLLLLCFSPVANAVGDTLMQMEDYIPLNGNVSKETRENWNYKRSWYVVKENALLNLLFVKREAIGILGFAKLDATSHQ